MIEYPSAFAVVVTPARPDDRCERASASERAATNGLRGRGTP